MVLKIELSKYLIINRMKKMPKQLRSILLIFILSISVQAVAVAQGNVIDQIVAIVGNNVILKSDIETVYQQRQAQGYTTSGDAKCEILEDLLVEKLLLAQAQNDTTIEATPSQVNRSLDDQMQRFMSNFNSVAELEKYFNKSIVNIKADMETMITNQILTQQMQQKIVTDVAVTPSEVRYFYRNLKEDEKPTVRTQIEFAQVSLIPRVTDEEDLRVKTRLRELKKRIEDGDSFASMAVLYSEGPSARNGGELPNYSGRAELDPAYAAAAFNLKGDRISNVVKSEFGYHIIQTLDRKGEKIRTRHILMKPKVDPEELTKAHTALDSLGVAINEDKISFEDAARRYSHDKNSRNNGGLVINPNSLESKFQLDALEGTESKVLSKMKVGEMSQPFESIDDKGRKVVKIVKLVKRIEAHKANLKEDYKRVSDMFLNKKREEAMNKWIAEEQSKTYISIDESFQNCTFKFDNWIK
ncbi:peptidylprolyl isomerase [Puteibacter caeruleilacunae]|nr:peptidylprolyl isomerase [Puteibacter caeruleilacunae]